MSKIEEIRKRHQERQAGEEPADYSLAFEEAHEDRATLLAALDGEWQSERPAAGDWWVAIHPNQRAGCKKTVYEVWVTGADEVITRTNCVHRLEDEIFTGALWQLRTVPADPFKKETNHE